MSFRSRAAVLAEMPSFASRSSSCVVSCQSPASMHEIGSGVGGRAEAGLVQFDGVAAGHPWVGALPQDPGTPGLVPFLMGVTETLR